MRTGHRFLKAAMVVGLLGGLMGALWPAYRLEVSGLNGIKPFLCFPVSVGDRFSIRFLHSYDRAFFQENYQINLRHQILLRDMVFKSHLNGSGFAYPHFHLRPDGVGELRDIYKVKEKVRFMMGSKDLADHTLIFKGTTIHLFEWFEPFDIVEIRLKKRVLLWDIFEKIVSSFWLASPCPSFTSTQPNSGYFQQSFSDPSTSFLPSF